MGLASIAKTAARIGFAIAGSPTADGVKRVVTVRAGASSVHDKTTDTSAVTWAHEWTGEALVYDEEEREAKEQGAPKLRLRSVLLQASEIPFEPVEEGQLQDGDRTYTVLDVSTDPAKATWSLTLKR